MSTMPSGPSFVAVNQPWVSMSAIAVVPSPPLTAIART